MAVKADDLTPRYRAPQYCARETSGRMHQSRVSPSGTYERFGELNEGISENTFTDDDAATFAGAADLLEFERYYRERIGQASSLRRRPRDFQLDRDRFSQYPGDCESRIQSIIIKVLKASHWLQWILLGFFTPILVMLWWLGKLG